jgi:hypothetical protein
MFLPSIHKCIEELRKIGYEAHVSKTHPGHPAPGEDVVTHGREGAEHDFEDTDGGRSLWI